MSGSALLDRLGVCSWSLHAADPRDLANKLAELKLASVQLALSPLVNDPAKWGAAPAELARAGVQIVSGMMGCVGEDYSTIDAIRRTGGVVPDATWPATLANMRKAGPIAQSMGLKLVTLHAGFIPHESSDPKFKTVVDRIATIADVFKAHGAQIALETGQEHAGALVAFLRTLDRDDIGVNFDPANMILYSSGDPVDAVKKLFPWIKQVHIKDATAGPDAETWGREVPVGTGEVAWPAFFAALEGGGYAGPYVIEREAGEQRIADILRAKQFLLDTYGKAV